MFLELNILIEIIVSDFISIEFYLIFLEMKYYLEFNELFINYNEIRFIFFINEEE